MATAYIKKLKDVENNTIYPQSTTFAIVDSDGVNLDTIHTKFITAKEFENVEDVEDITMTYETINNRVSVIDSNSTDSTYPTAAAVYNLVMDSKELGLNVIIVEEKPTINIDTKAIYLIKKLDEFDEGNIYEEWMYINNNWEKIGDTQTSINLDGYATTEMLDDYAKKTELNDYATNSFINEKFTNYSTTIESNEKYASKTLYNDTTINIGRNPESVTGVNSTAEGQVTTAAGEASHAEGRITSASGKYAHAEGYSTLASGENSHAEGSTSKATNISAHAEGLETNAYGIASHSEGAYTVANSDFSHAEGYSTLAMGNYSHTEGQGTRTDKECGHAQGRYNTLDTNKEFLHIVGNGTAEESRSNAHTLKENGEAWFAGDVYVGSASGINKDTGSKKLATEAFVNSRTISSTVDIGKGAELASGTIYLVYEE